MKPDFEEFSQEIEPDFEENLDWIDQELTLETPEMPANSLIHRRKPARRKNLGAIKEELLSDFLTELPQPGESFHIVSNGKFDYWKFVPVCLGLMHSRQVEFYGSTWTISRPNVLEMLQLFDEGKIKPITFFSGLYFKRRETAVYTQLVSGLMDRGQRFLCFDNHTKIILLSDQIYWLVLEGSANFTANPRLEQNILTNDRGLYEFHQSWMEGMFRK